MFSNNRDAYRQSFFMAWEKYKKKRLLEPVETQLVEIILLHAEYQALLSDSQAYQHQEFDLEDNPFFHMSLHLAIREQIRTNRPAGIAHIHQHLIQQALDPHEAEHRMMKCLANIIWKAQQNGVMPTDEAYLEIMRHNST